MAYPESTHPYLDNLDETQVYTEPGGPAHIWVTFDPLTATEAGFDFIYLYDFAGNPAGDPLGYSGVELAGVTIHIPGDTVRVRLTSDFAIPDWGYRVTSVVTVAPPLTLTESSIHVQQNIAANHNLVAAGGTAPYTFSEATDWPTGLVVSAGGVVTGTAVVSESKNTTIRITDALGTTTVVALVVYVEPPLYLVDPALHVATYVQFYTSTTGVTYCISYPQTAGARFFLIWKSVDGVTWTVVATGATPGAPPSSTYRTDVSWADGNRIALRTFTGVAPNYVPHTWIFEMNADTFTEMPVAGIAPYDILNYPGSVAGLNQLVKVWIQGNYIFHTYRHYIGDHHNGRLFCSVYEIGAGWLYVDVEISSGDPVTVHPITTYYYDIMMLVHGTLAHWAYIQDGNDAFGSGDEWTGIRTRTLDLATGLVGASTYLLGTLQGEVQLNNGHDRVVQGTINFQTQVPIGDYLYSAFKSRLTGHNDVTATLLKWGPFAADAPVFAVEVITDADPDTYDEHALYFVNGKYRVYSVNTFGTWPAHFGDSVTYYESDTGLPGSWSIQRTFFWWNNNWPAAWMTGAGFPGATPVIYNVYSFPVGAATWIGFITRTDFAFGEAMVVGPPPAAPAPVPPVPPVVVPISLRSFSIGKPYIKCGNVWDWCLKNSECPWYLIPWAEHGCIPVKCWRLEDDSLHSIPEQGRELHKWGSIPLPAIPNLDTQILSFRVPLGYDGIIYSVLCKFTGTGYVNGDGNLYWRFRQNAHWIKSLHSIPTELGDYTAYAQMEEYIRVYSGQTIRAYGWLAPLSGLVGGSMIAALQGWYFPSQFAR